MANQIIGIRIHSEVCRLLIGGWTSSYDKPHIYQRTAWINRSSRTVATIYAIIDRSGNTLTITCEEFITNTIPWKTTTVHHNIARDDLFTEADTKLMDAATLQLRHAAAHTTSPRTNSKTDT